MAARFLSFAILVLIATLVNGQIIYVAVNGTGTAGTQAAPFGSLKSAVTYARNTPAITTIMVGSGTFLEATTVPTGNPTGKMLSIIGAGQSSTFLRCGSNFPILFTSNAGDNYTVSSLTISGCVGNRNGGTLYASTGSTLSISSVTIRDSTSATSSGGCGVYIDASTLNVNNCLFTNITGGAILLTNGPTTARISQSRFTKSSGTGTLPGIIYADSTTSLTVSNSVFISNQGGIRVVGTLSATGNSFYDSTKSGNIGAIVCPSAITLTQSANQFCGNFGNYISCSTWTTQSTPVIVKNDFCGICNGDNSARDCTGTCYGGATTCPAPATWYVSSGSGATSGNGTVSNPFGSILQAITAAAYFNDTIILLEGTYTGVNNTNLDFLGKTIWMRSMYFQPDNTTLTCISSKPTFNMHSGESYDTIIEGITISGCNPSNALVLNSSSPTIRNVVLKNNVQSLGPAIYMSNSFAVISRVQVIANNLRTTGTGSVFITSPSGSASDVIITNSRFSGNTAGTTTGIYVDVNSIVSIYGTLFDSDIASSTRELFVATGSTFRMYTSSVYLSLPVSSNSISCSAGAVINSQSNMYCGNNTGTIACSGLNITNGGSSYDKCGACTGGGNYSDCSGACWGFALPDIYGGCCHPRNRDCNGRCFGFAVIDDFGTCCANASFIDCAGKCNGTKRLDKSVEPICCERSTFDCASICSGNSTNDRFNTCCLYYYQDCDHVCNGTSSNDKNGTCCQTSYHDCNDICNGTSVIDKNGTCCQNITLDCNGICSGLSVLDHSSPVKKCCLPDKLDCAYICDGESVNDRHLPNPQCCLPRQLDCSRLCFGTAIYDRTNVSCCVPELLDCDTICNGTKRNDSSTPTPLCCDPSRFDCSGICNGTKTNDSSIPLPKCCEPGFHDCADICNGTHVNDTKMPEICCEQNVTDCFGVCNGTAVRDNTTDHTCCASNHTIDCGGVCNGTNRFDNNSMCCLNSSIDCLGVCSGMATYDNRSQCCHVSDFDSCGVCSGNNSCFVTSLHVTSALSPSQTTSSVPHTMATTASDVSSSTGSAYITTGRLPSATSSDASVTTTVEPRATTQTVSNSSNVDTSPSPLALATTTKYIIIGVGVLVFLILLILIIIIVFVVTRRRKSKKKHDPNSLELSNQPAVVMNSNFHNSGDTENDSSDNESVDSRSRRDY